MSKPRKPKGRPVSGWLILDKPVDFGSTEAVSKIKWLFKAQKAGHAGTLDPLASGMLPIALGDATKTVPYVMDGRKIYEFTVTWGEERATDDLEGEVIEDVGQASERRGDPGAAAEIYRRDHADRRRSSPQSRSPANAPMISPATARRSKSRRAKSRLSGWTLLALPGCHRQRISRVECGKGTYVRALARDLGRDLGCYGHISGLRRSFVAPFAEDTMVPLG